MCGIAGFVDFFGSLDESDLLPMITSLHHRGPDDQSFKVFDNASARIGLAHARLAILDLSEAGRQPMNHGPFTIVYNGEVYNFRELRKELVARGHEFRTETDTEVIIHSFDEWGVSCLDRFVGMFAFVLYDSIRKMVYFVRDRVGVKPLYVYRDQKCILFGSELKALTANKGFKARISPRDLKSYFRHGYVPDDGCIFQDCHKVDAGTYWVIDLETRRCDRVRWWSQTMLHKSSKLELDFEEAADALEDLLRSACEYRMVADVPVGVFLSGGYDSTAVAALLQTAQSRKLKTFTIGFTEGNDEAPHARATARHLGTDHYELYCSPVDVLEVLGRLPDVYDEPFADSSAIPTLLVSRLARQTVKVALSADGGDELFCGYDSYLATLRRVRKLSRVPLALRGVIGGSMRAASALLPESAHAMRHRLLGLGHSLNYSDVLMSQRLHEHSREMPKSLIESLIPGASVQGDHRRDRAWPSGLHPIEAAMGIDYQTYLKDDILTKVDRATMSVGLEGREPLLDHRVAEFAARLPFEYKYDGRITKRILKHVVHRYVPESMMSRPKAGFSLPIMKWLRGDLRHMLRDTCSRDRMSASGLIDPMVCDLWLRRFFDGSFHYSPLIWRLFVFQSWYSRIS